MSCLGESTIAEWVDGVLPLTRRERATAHVHDCDLCRHLVAAATRARRAGDDDDDDDDPTRCAHVQPSARHPPSPPRRRLAIPTFAPGASVAGRYRIDRFIGAGGMGEVYAAVDTELESPVALKTIAPEHAGDPHLVARLKREIQLARRITHRNVCRIFDFGVHRHAAVETVFLTMELLDGECLSERLRREGPLGLDELLPIVDDLAAGLSAAHEVGVVHRDFKTANVMLVPLPGRGLRAVVIDFGLARASEGDPFAAAATTRDAVAGSAPYIAPEQLEGRRADATADIYALGVVLFELSTGKLPFDGATPTEMAMCRLRKPPHRPSAFAPAMSPIVEATILRCLEREPERRYASVADVAAALRAGDPTAMVASGSPARVSLAAQWAQRARAAAKAPAVRYALVAAAAALVGLCLSLVTRARHAAPRAAATPPASSVAPAAGARRAFVLLPLDDLVAPDDPWRAVAAGELVRALVDIDGAVRVIGGDELARLVAPGASGPTARARVERRFAPALALTGSVRPVGDDGVEIELQAHDAAGASLPAVSERGPAVELPAIALRAAARLRQTIGLVAVDAAPARAALPESASALRLFAQGLARLRGADEAGARDLLQRAADAAPTHARAHAQLAAAFYALGDYAHAERAAERAVALAATLPAPERLAVQAQARASARQWAEAARLLRERFTRAPDDVALGCALAYADWASGDAAAGFAVAAELHRLPAPLGDDPAIALTEARLALATSAWARSRAAAAHAVERATALGDDAAAATAQRLESAALLRLGDPATALTLAEHALVRAERAGDPGEQIDSLLAIGVAQTRAGAPAEAERQFDEALRRANARGSLFRARRALDDLAIVAGWQRRWRAAARLGQQSAAVAALAGDRDGQALALRQSAERFDDAGALAEADAAWTRVAELARAAADGEGEASALAARASVTLRRGDGEEARRLAEAALAKARRINSVAAEAAALEALGDAQLWRGDLALARRSLEQCAAVSSAAPLPRGRCLAALSRALYAADDQPGALARAREAGAPGRVALGEALLAAADVASATIAARDADDAGATVRERRLAALLLARVRLSQSRPAEARTCLQRALDGLESNDDLALLSAARAVQAELAAAEHATDATDALAPLVAELQRRQLPGLARPLALAIARAELDGEDAARRQHARAQLETLARDAAADGFRRVARQATALLAR